MHPVLIGPAGWSYADWKGVFYPPNPPRNFSQLEYLSRFFPVVEVNMTFYRIPPVSMVQKWLQTVEHRDFKFCVKAWQGFTHQSAETSAETVQFMRCLEPMAERERLAAVLLQFPWSFKYSPESLARLEQLLAIFRPYPCAVEFRHGSWQTPQVYDLLRQNRVAFVNIDQPVIGESIVPSDEVTAPFAYVRLHGRNRANWFRQDAGRDDRYNYLYSEDELKEWEERIRNMAEKAPTIVIFNNHFRGQATLNAFQLMHDLFKMPPIVPATLKASFPKELAFARPDSLQLF
ncbi:MAG: DUF72 domain-containing protein [candidate division KSB1 bacterium]|nr:DUF72 domain-containing protein [candidate division KSB1 bacterium]